MHSSTKKMSQSGKAQFNLPLFFSIFLIKLIPFNDLLEEIAFIFLPNADKFVTLQAGRQDGSHDTANIAR